MEQNINKVKELIQDESSTEQIQDSLTIDAKLQAMMGISIKHAVDVKAVFELYAYRILSHQKYVEEITRLTEEFQEALNLINTKY